jgi:hypothetical protein
MGSLHGQLNRRNLDSVLKAPVAWPAACPTRNAITGHRVAATAIWLQVPLVAHEGIFANVKDLELLTKLTD